MKDPHPLYGMIEPVFGTKYWSDPRSLEGRSRGFSWCMACGATWDWVKAFDIPIGDGRGCFPVCVDCGWSMSDQEILGYLERYDRNLAQFYPIQGPDGKMIERKPIDLEYAKKAVSEWRIHRQEGETPHRTHGRLLRGPVAWEASFRGGETAPHTSKASDRPDPE